MKAWHVAALFAAVFFMKGAAWMAAFAALLRWARP